MRNVVVLLIVSVGVVLLSLSLFPLTLESSKLSSGNTRFNYKTEANKQAKPVSEPLTASLRIYIHGLPKDLSDDSFLNQSSQVYLAPNNPHKITVSAQDITWQEFFVTLPMSFSDSCLISEVNQEFCEQDDLQLYYYLNGKLDENIFSKEIQNGDSLLITYGDLTKAEINYQLSQF